MVRRSPFSPRRHPRPAALELTHSTLSSPHHLESNVAPTQIIHITHNGPYFCGDNDEHDEQARASAELAHTQALFSASLESDPIPGVRARSPTAYRTAGKSLPMEVEISISVDVEGRPSLEDSGYRPPLPTGGYKFPPTDAECQFLPLPIQRPLVETSTPRRNGGCSSLSWMKLVRALRRRRAAGRKLPEPVGFRERIAHAEHEWRPLCVGGGEDKGRVCLPELVSSDTFVDWPWR
ncbi:unnamed protein product [Rhizoctonia solani]|uniref:Uncharacterized protein n=1 Tax=Rhizoctonia solani TaxID=456999 RepID=A0A8H3HU23_9AGAM|nr:unnamed protein product [Rhizoctonia solani]